MPYILYFGHVNLDITLKVKDFGNIGESRAVNNYEKRIGGTAYNAYKSLRSLDVPAHIFSVIGPEIKDLDGIFIKDEKTPTCWIITNGEEQMAYIYQGLWNRLDTLKIEVPVQNYDILHFSTGNPRFYLKIAEKAREYGKFIGFDPSQEIHYIYDKEIFKKMLSLADVFFCNEKEYARAEYLAGEDLYKNKIVRTEGSRGASFYDPEKGWIHVPGVPREPVDTLGAGDSFRAGFYAGLYRGYSILESIKIGNIVASYVVMNDKSYYTGSWEDIESMRKEI